MGLSINYSGSLKNAASLEAMIEDVKEVAKIYRALSYVEIPEQTEPLIPAKLTRLHALQQKMFSSSPGFIH